MDIVGDGSALVSGIDVFTLIIFVIIFVIDRRFYGTCCVMAAQRQNAFDAVLARQVLANDNDNGLDEADIALLLEAYHLEGIVDSDSDTLAEADSESEDEDARSPHCRR